MSKWKFIAQDKDGDILFYDAKPSLMQSWIFFPNGKDLKLVEKGKPNPNFKDTLINLKTEDYEINDGILTRIPRKTKLDKLIANVKKIDKKAAKWMNKNRHKLEDVNDLSLCFNWDDCEKYDWCYIHEKLIDLEQEPATATATETLKYRVGSYHLCDEKQLYFATNQDHADLIESYPEFAGWLTDWIEVQKND